MQTVYLVEIIVEAKLWLLQLATAALVVQAQGHLKKKKKKRLQTQETG